MNARGASLTILTSMFVALLSTQFTYLDFRTFSPSSVIQSLTARSLEVSRRHHRRTNDHNTSICDDFPPNFPPPDTNMTSNLCVDRNGCCNFTTVQLAVNAVGMFSQKRNVIWINSGIYFEKVTVPKTKPNITFQGQGMGSTAIIWNDTANSSGGTFYSASVSVFGANFIAKNISFMNVAPTANPGAVGAQAVAIRVGGDAAAFFSCGFFGTQDTLHDDRGRHYFKDCFIQGSIDFIFGNGRSLYENCQLSSIANPVPAGQKSITGAVTAHGRMSKDENTGFVFVNCSIGGSGRIWLGRAWRPFSRVIYINTLMTDIISPDGWNDFNDPARDQTVFYAEYNSSGGGANATMRVPYSLQINDTLVSSFNNISYIEGQQWLLPYLT